MFLIEVTETYRVNNENEAIRMIDEARNSSQYMLKKHNSEFKEVKQKGEIIETYWKVTLTTVFDDMKARTGSTTIEYNTNGESAY